MYKLEKRMNGSVPVYFISLDGAVDGNSFEYLNFLRKQNKSPNTLKRYAWSIIYFYNYLFSLGVNFDEIGRMNFEFQLVLFHDFLFWLKDGKHKTYRHKGGIKNKTCNAILKDIFLFYLYLVDFHNYELLKIFRFKQTGYIDNKGTYHRISTKKFDFFLNENEDEAYVAHFISEDEEKDVFEGLRNLRDVALVRLLLDTGIRIGEALGIKQNELDLNEMTVKIQFSRLNENGARAKRGENRKVCFSRKTQKALFEYMEKYKNVLMHGEMLFVKIQGKLKGHGMEKVDVDSCFRRLEEKTGIHIHSHLCRHKFASERENAGWEIINISRALGHRSIRTTEVYLNAIPARCESKEREFFASQEENIDVDFLL